MKLMLWEGFDSNALADRQSVIEMFENQSFIRLYDVMLDGVGYNYVYVNHSTRKLLLFREGNASVSRECYEMLYRGQVSRE